MIAKIVAVKAIEILDSRGVPTIEVAVTLADGSIGRAAVPAGASCGLQEACELRDGGKRYAGKGVLQAVNNVNTLIAPALISQDVEQTALDNLLCSLDGTKNKAKLGANAILATSLAVAKAAALANNLPLYLYIAKINSGIMQLPLPLLNVINGGSHASNNLDIQEFMLVPLGAPTFAESLRFGAEVTLALRTRLRALGYVTAVGDEGGVAPDLSSNQAALDLLMKAIVDVGLVPGKDVSLALDIAASELYNDGLYHLSCERRSLTSSQFITYLEELVRNYPLVSIEDGMDEADLEGWQLLTQALGQKIQLIGDDLFVTNSEILAKGIKLKLANAILIKPNQIGTLSETLATINLAKQYNYSAIISHRSGETEDTIIADLAVGLGCGQIKAGALCRGERIAKYNQLLRIAHADVNMPFAGSGPFAQYKLVNKY